MKFKRCSSPACGRPFQVNQFTLRLSHSYESGKVTCPHCGAQASDDGSSVFLTHALSAKEEADFNAAHTLGAEQLRSAEHGHADNHPSHHPEKHKISGDKHGGHPSAHETGSTSQRAERSSSSNGSSSHSQ